mmetsp:Transcript_87332/g.151985  ORF Transcript_87332/g.151985 Transcript_87332/m.151985 type:complete len:257 (-) Transcript_87332:452-1222(-)
MVVLKVKGKSEKEIFLYETSTKSAIDEVVTEIVEMWNLRLRIKWYITNGEELAKETGCEQLKKAVEDAREYTSVEYANRRKPCEKGVLEEHIKVMRGATMIANPQDYSKGVDVLAKEVESLEIESEDVRLKMQYTLQMMLDDCASGDMNEILDPHTAVMWFASKEMHRDKELWEFTGKNEKSTVLVKLTANNQHAPGKEPPVDQQMQKEMMAYWFKKQEEEKRIAEDDEIGWEGATWADPKQLKGAFQGLKDLKIR